MMNPRCWIHPPDLATHDKWDPVWRRSNASEMAENFQPVLAAVRTSVERLVDNQLQSQCAVRMCWFFIIFQHFTPELSFSIVTALIHIPQVISILSWDSSWCSYTYNERGRPRSSWPLQELPSSIFPPRTNFKQCRQIFATPSSISICWPGKYRRALAPQSTQNRLSAFEPAWTLSSLRELRLKREEERARMQM